MISPVGCNTGNLVQLVSARDSRNPAVGGAEDGGGRVELGVGHHAEWDSLSQNRSWELDAT